MNISEQSKKNLAKIRARYEQQKRDTLYQGQGPFNDPVERSCVSTVNVKPFYNEEARQRYFGRQDSNRIDLFDADIWGIIEILDDCRFMD